MVVTPEVAQEFRKLRETDDGAADAVVRAMAVIPRGAEPFDLPVAGDPARYWASVSGDQFAPVPIYRKSRQDEPGEW